MKICWYFVTALDPLRGGFHLLHLYVTIKKKKTTEDLNIH